LKVPVLTIALVNMPFAALQRPSIALTLLKGVLDRRFAGRVNTSIRYVNQDFGRDYGVDRYQHVVTSIDAHNGGFGDWFFRQEAFPDTEDNSAEYFSRYYVQRTPEQELMRQFVALERPRLGAYLDTLIDRHALDHADIVGFTSMFAQNVASFAMARRIKARNPRCAIVVGGANCEASMGREIATHVDAVDFAFSGPALESFPEFVRLTLDGDLDGRHRLGGVFSKHNRVRPVAGAVGGANDAEDALPEVALVGTELGIDTEVPLDYQGFLTTLDQNFPGGGIEPALLFETSRGCWWGERAHCTFCGLNSDSMGYRSMSPERALALIRSMFAYAPRVRRLECVDNIMPRSYLKDVFPHLEAPDGLTIFYEVKADLTEADLAVLSKAGVRSLQPGIEALATSTLKLMKKGTSGLGNVRFLKHCLKHDVYPEWNLLVGFPGEDEQVYAAYERDLPLLAHLPPPSGVYPVRFDRFSPYFTRAAEFGLDLHPYDFYGLVYPMPAASLDNLAYYFIDQNFGADYATRTARWIGRLRSRIEAWRDRWHHGGRTVLPRLFVTEVAGDARVYDSRSGEVLLHPLTAERRQLLGQLDTPSTVEQLGKNCALPVEQVTVEIGWLQSHGLITGEGGRFLSLVFPREPALMTSQRPTDVPVDVPPPLVARARDERRIRRTVLTAGPAE
jgi:magnesium-protoporphyrin IX monomethyl ester (oxidative) cyclase